MDLVARIKENLTDVPSPHSWSYHGPGTTKGLTPEAKKTILDEVKAYFKALGWKVKKMKSQFFIARLPNSPAKIRFEIDHPPTIELYQKTDNGGWSMLGFVASYTPWRREGFKSLQDMVERTKTIKTPVIISKDTLPDGYEFNGDPTTIEKNEYYGYRVVISGSQIYECRVANVVGLNQDGGITSDIKIVAKPGEQVWFHLDCQAKSGATFDIISDGEIFYPIKRYGKQRVTANLKPKPSINLEMMNEFDRAMVNKAIEIYFEDNNKGDA